MQRQTGYYWVKEKEGTVYEILKYYDSGIFGAYWLFANSMHPDSRFHEINETRILNPDEQKEKK